jgi:hypothetical protein
MPATPAQVTALAAYCQAAAGDAYVAQCANEAADMVALPVSKLADPAVVPASVVGRAVLEVGKELFDRRQSRNGIAGLDGTDFAPMRIARDPMKAAMPYLQPYLGPAIA